MPMVWQIRDWKSKYSSDSVRIKRRKFTFAKPLSFGVMSRSAPELTRKIPGFTKLAWPSSLLARNEGIKLPGEVSATPEPVRRMPSRFQKLKRPPAKFGRSRMESNPRARELRGSESPDV